MIDRRRLANDLLPTLTSTGHLVDVARRPAGGGGDPSGQYTPHAILWPQPTVFTPDLADAHARDDTILQLTCVATDPDLSMRVAHDLEQLALAPPSTLAGRQVTDVRIVLSRGPERDPKDERLWYCVIQPRFRTRPT